MVIIVVTSFLSFGHPLLVVGTCFLSIFISFFVSMCLPSYLLVSLPVCQSLNHTYLALSNYVHLSQCSYGLDVPRIGVRFLAGRIFALLHYVLTGSWAHPISYPICIEDFCPRMT
jgi:hypothetical protein